MQSHDRLAGTSRPRDPGRPAIVPFNQCPLARMEEDRPLLPRSFQRTFQLLAVGHDAKAALGIGVVELVRIGWERRRNLRRSPGCQLEQCLRRLCRQVVGQLEKGVLGSGPGVFEPVAGHSEAKQFVIRLVGEEKLLGRPAVPDRPREPLRRPFPLPPHLKPPKDPALQPPPVRQSRPIAPPRVAALRPPARPPESPPTARHPSAGAAPVGAARPNDKLGRDDRRSRSGSCSRFDGRSPADRDPHALTRSSGPAPSPPGAASDLAAKRRPASRRPSSSPPSARRPEAESSCW